MNGPIAESVNWSSLIELMMNGPTAPFFYILLIMSVLCWYQTIYKLVTTLWRYRCNVHLLNYFYQSKEINALTGLFVIRCRSSCFRLLLRGWNSYQKVRIESKHSDLDRWVREEIEQQLDDEYFRLESGLPLLGCISATAPFVGLLGTVFGIIHALNAISNGGQSSIDQIAGPIGEALTMTGLGLLVAIPAVIFYNMFNRFNRREYHRLLGYAFRLHALLITGTPVEQASDFEKLSAMQHSLTENEYGI